MVEILSIFSLEFDTRFKRLYLTAGVSKVRIARS
jgi:hypothetical protein